MCLCVYVNVWVCHWRTCLHSFQRIIHFLLKWGSSPGEEGLKGGWEQAFILLQQQLVVWGVNTPVGHRDTGRKARRVREEWKKEGERKGSSMQGAKRCEVRKKKWWDGEKRKRKGVWVHEMTVGVMGRRQRRKRMGFSKGEVQGDRRSSGRIGRKTALMDEKQKNGMEIIKA